MTIQEILTAHKSNSVRYRAEDVVIRCACGTDWNGDTTPKAEISHRAHVAEVLEKHMQEREAGAWRKGVDTALNHAIQNPDGITLRLEHLDGRPWANPYRKDTTNGR